MIDLTTFERDALTERLGTKRLKALLAEGVIEIAPVAYMRGRTLNDCFIVIDEAQNCTYGQIKMLLTRLGWRSTMVSASRDVAVLPREEVTEETVRGILH